MNFLSNIFHAKSDKYVLVISGGGVRWFYGLGILKAMEELWIGDKIEAVYGVSAGAIIGAYWAAGHNAQETFDIFIHFAKAKLFSWKNIGILNKKSLLSSELIRDQFESDLPKTFGELNKKLYIGAVDTNKARFHLFDEWDIYTPLVGSMSIPWIFPPISYKEFSLVDGGVLDNFPVDKAREHYPHNKIIWIYLNQFLEDQKITSVFDGLSLTYEILLRWPSIAKFDIPDHLFSRHLNIKVLSMDTKEMEKIFLLWYADGMKEFSKK